MRTILTDKQILDLIDNAWYYETKGELPIDSDDPEFHDAELASFVLATFKHARAHADEDASEQFTRDGQTEIEGALTDEMIAERVCMALTTLYWGWSN